MIGGIANSAPATLITNRSTNQESEKKTSPNIYHSFSYKLEEPSPVQSDLNNLASSSTSSKYDTERSGHKSYKSSSIPIPVSINAREAANHQRAYALEYDYKRLQMLSLMKKVMHIDEKELSLNEGGFETENDSDSDADNDNDDCLDGATDIEEITKANTAIDDFECFVFEI